MPLSRRAALLGLAAGLGGCVTEQAMRGPDIMAPEQLAGAEGDRGRFVMSDGAALPYRVWRPQGPVRAVALALHGFNDSRDAWEIPAPDLAAQGVLVYAPDQRGFGEAPGRGLWAGTEAMVDDAATMAGLLRRRHPGLRLVMLGESMGGAVLMCLATQRKPDVDGYVLVAPAVWGRARMNYLMQGSLWMAATFVPGLAVGRGPIRVTPSDNRDALIRLSRNRLTLHETRFDTLRGLVDLMDAALESAEGFAAPGLFLYGGHDELVPAKATVSVWRRLPAPAIRAFYPDGYHLLPRDLGRAAPNADMAAFIVDGARPVAAEAAARVWMTEQG